MLIVIMGEAIIIKKNEDITKKMKILFFYDFSNGV